MRKPPVPPRKYPTEESFWASLDRSGECWNWTGWTMPPPSLPYGRLGFNGYKTWKSHRLAWALTNGPVPKGMFVCHRCDNPRCCNPAHLFLGTTVDNNHDRARKGRSARGSGCGSSKLTEERVREIRELQSDGASTRALARRYGVSWTTIAAVIKGLYWRHVA
jgi:hypothetical protein